MEVKDWAEDYDDESPVEVERRHPGDKIEDDAEIEYAINEMFSPLTMKAGCTLLQAIHFVSDRERKLLVYDCLEYKPALVCSSPEFKPAKDRALRRITPWTCMLELPNLQMNPWMETRMKMEVTKACKRRRSTAHSRRSNFTDS